MRNVEGVAASDKHPGTRPGAAARPRRGGGMPVCSGRVRILRARRVSHLAKRAGTRHGPVTRSRRKLRRCALVFAVRSVAVRRTPAAASTSSRCWATCPWPSAAGAARRRRRRARPPRPHAARPGSTGCSDADPQRRPAPPARTRSGYSPRSCSAGVPSSRTRSSPSGRNPMRRRYPAWRGGPGAETKRSIPRWRNHAALSSKRNRPTPKSR